MASNVPVVIKLTAVDAVTAKLAGMNAKLAKMTGPITRTSMSFKSLGGEVGRTFSTLGVTQAISSLGKVGSAGKEFLGEVVGAATKAGLAITGAGASLFALAHTFSQSGDNIKNVSERLGLTTDAFQELSYAALQGDISQEDFTQAMTRLQKAMVETRMGTGEAQHAFNALGISMAGQGGRIKKSEEIFGEFADGIASVKDEALRTKLVLTVFGKSGAPMLNMLKDGAAGIQKFRDEARKIGAVMDKDQIKAAEEFDSGMKSIGATLTSVRNIIGAAVAPAILNLGRTLQDYILKHTDDIKDFAKQFADALPGAIDKAIAFLKYLKDAVQPVLAVLKMLTDYFGVMNVALTALVAYVAGPVISSFLGLASAILSSVASMSTMILSLGRLAVGALMPAISAIVAFIGSVASGSTVMAAFNAIMIANPIGVIVTAVGLLAAGFYFLYKNVEPVAELVDSFFGTLKKIGRFLLTPILGWEEAQIKTPDLPKGNFGLDIGPNSSNQLSSFSPPTLGPNSSSQLSSFTPPTLGPSLGVASVASQAAKGSVNQTESRVQIDFSNMPRGTRVETTKTETPLDFSIGYAGAGLD